MGIRKNIVYWGEYKYFPIFSIIFRANKTSFKLSAFSCVHYIDRDWIQQRLCIISHINSLFTLGTQLLYVAGYFRLQNLFSCIYFMSVIALGIRAVDK